MGKVMGAAAGSAANGDARPRNESDDFFETALAERLGRVLARAFVAALQDRNVQAALVAIQRFEAATPALLSPRELASRLGVSVAHVRRLDPPHTCAGDKSTKRYDFDVVTAWLAEREPKPTTPIRRATAVEVDIDDIAAAAGLRVVGGGR